MKVVRAHCMDRIDELLRVALPMMQTAMEVQAVETGAKLTITVWLTPEENGEYELTVAGRTALPMPSTAKKARIVKGQMHLL